MGKKGGIFGIEEIASYIPAGRIDNYERKERFGIENAFIDQKLGVHKIARKDDDEDVSDLCVKAYERLQKKVELHEEGIDVLIVITQNPDTNIPHSSAIVHGKLDLDERCACFDISLGCSGFPYGLSVMASLMRSNDFQRGLLFTADPYSKIIDDDDRDTSLLFGDAATVTLVSNDPLYLLDDITFGTVGKEYRGLICKDGRLYMNGRALFKFVMNHIPDDIKVLLKRNGLQVGDIDKYVFHQASRFIVENLRKSLKIEDKRVVFDMHEYGNTVSSSIPLILEKEIKDENNRKILISGFGVGLSWSSGILERV